MTKRLAFERGLAGLALFLVASGCIFNCNPGPPEPARCMGSTPDDAALDEIALFSTREIRGPLAEGDTTDIEVGGQGFTMATVRAGWRGGDAPECAKVKITIDGTTTEG